MVGGKRWEIFLMLRICRIKLTLHDVPGLIGTKLTGICPPAAGATGAELAERVDSGAWNLYKQFTQIHLGRSSKLLENRKELMGCSLSTNGLWIFLYCFCSWHVSFFSPLFRDELSMGVFLHQLCPTILTPFVQVSSAFRCWRCIHFFTSLMLLTPRQDNIRRRDKPWRFYPSEEVDECGWNGWNGWNVEILGSCQAIKEARWAGWGSIFSFVAS